MATRKTSIHFLSLSWILSPFHVNHSIPQTTSPAPPFPPSTSHGSILCGSFGYRKDRFNGIDCWSSDSLKDHLGNHLLHGLLPPLALQSLEGGYPEGGGFHEGEVDPFHGSRNSIYFPINSSLHPPTIYPGSIPEAQKRKHRLEEELDFF